MIIDVHRWYVIVTDGQQEAVFASTPDGIMHFATIAEYREWEARGW